MIALVIVTLLQLNYCADIGGRITVDGGSTAMGDCDKDGDRNVSRVMRDEFVYSSLTEVPNSLSVGLYEAITFDMGMGFRGGRMFQKGVPMCRLDEATQAARAMGTIVGGLTGTMMWATYLGYAIFRKKPSASLRMKSLLIGIIVLPYLLGAALISVLTA